MAQVDIDRDMLKRAVKAALVEMLQEHRALLQELFSEVLEDFTLGAAIHEGQMTEEVERPVDVGRQRKDRQ